LHLEHAAKADQAIDLAALVANGPAQFQSPQKLFAGRAQLSANEVQIPLIIQGHRLAPTIAHAPA